jgi:hypothetical protein
MHDAIAGVIASAALTASASGTPDATSAPERSAGLTASIPSQNASPSPGVCQILAKSCH